MTRFGTTALALTLSAGTAFAANHSDGDAMSEGQTNEMAQSQSGMQSDSGEMAANDGTVMDSATLIRSRDITGGNVYMLSSGETYDWDSDLVFEAVSAEWTDIGEIEDIVLTSDGEMRGVIAEIGGFVDIGDKHVMLPVEDVRLVPVDDQRYSLVTAYPEEELEEFEGVDEGFWN